MHCRKRPPGGRNKRVAAHAYPFLRPIETPTDQRDQRPTCDKGVLFVVGMILWKHRDKLLRGAIPRIPRSTLLRALPPRRLSTTVDVENTRFGGLCERVIGEPSRRGGKQVWIPPALTPNDSMSD
jgi:hypothetical protein